MLPQLFLPHPLFLLRHLLPALSPPLPLLIRHHHQGPVAAPAEGGSGHWMPRLASAAAPSELRAVAAKTEGSTLNAAGQTTRKPKKCSV